MPPLTRSFAAAAGLSRPGSRNGSALGMRNALAWLLNILFLAAAAHNAAAQTSPLSCSGAQQPKLAAELLFGRDIGNRIGVSEAAWQNFVAHEITPRFPDGLTIVAATGQWRDPSRKTVVREPSKLVIIVLPGNKDDQARLAAIVDAYKRRFHQQSVGVILQSACASF
jgi:hypothetical protein